ncbi:MAG: FkbM family methyltransferase [Vicinamibacterales bacterium]
MKRLVRPLLSRAIRPRRIKAGPLRGTWLVTSWHDYPAGLLGRTERPLLEWFSTHVRPGDTWIDVGGHYGYTAFALARLVGATGHVFTFEPVATTAGCIDQGRSLNGLTQLTVLPIGLGAAHTLELRRLPLTRGMADATLAPGATAFVEVPFVGFDWIWPLVHDGSGVIHGIKIDVQGMELDVLDGMRDTLRRWRPRIVIELHTGVSRERILGFLNEVGYSGQAVAIDPADGEDPARLLDDRSYAFVPA